MNLDVLNAETEDAFANLLELAANNDLEGFKSYIDREPSSVDEVGLWYGRQRSSKQIVLQHRTPLMVAATYGSVDVLKKIIDLPEVDLNRSCGVDRSTALHCAASGGSLNAVDAVKLLLAAGGDPNLADASGHRPLDVIIVSPMVQGMKHSLQMMLTTDSLFQEEHNLRVSIGTSNTNSSSPGNESSLPKFDGVPVSSELEKKEYPVDHSLPDIKNSIYSSDEFRMFSFKIRPCSRAYSHDWTECPFVHPGENARRRDPRQYHYSCVPCPEFRRGSCQRGDMCEYAHGVFESWLHPAQYRTRLCKDSPSCNRRVCFFAHNEEELRPLYISSGSAILSPRSTTSAANAMDFAAATNLLPCSPSTVLVMSPSVFTPPMSPSNNGVSNIDWPSQQHVPPLHLPGSNLQWSRLRSSLNARDIPAKDLSLYADIGVRHLNELSLMSQLSIGTNLLNRCAHPKTLTPSNLENIFSAESSSPIKTKFSPTVTFGLPSPWRMSPGSMEPISPMSARVPMIAQREMQHQLFRSLSSREPGSNAAADVSALEETSSKLEAPNGTPEWAITSSFELVNNGEEPDLSWVQSLVKDSPQDMEENSASRTHIGGNAGDGTFSDEGENLIPRSNEQVDQFHG